MTKHVRLGGKDLASMVMAVRPLASERKLRLFACACCDRIAHLLTEAGSREAVEATLRATDGDADEADLKRATEAARQAVEAVTRRIVPVSFGDEEGWSPHQEVLEQEPAFNAAWAAVVAADSIGGWYAYEVAHFAARAAAREGWHPAQQRERAVQCDLFRDVFGTPFPPARLDPAWRTTSVLGVAQTAYELRRFEDLPILADALEDAGCSDDVILDHCRRPAAHVRGCWVVDGVLGRS